MHEIQASPASSSAAAASFNVVNIELEQNSDGSEFIVDLIQRQIKSGKKFYSIEVSPLNNLHLDFNKFLILPLFTSITWSSINLANHATVANAPALRLAKMINSTPVLQHLTCYNLTDDKLTDIMNENNFKNWLVVRGDSINYNQTPFKHAIHLLQKIKEKKPKTCTAVAGYPAGHPEAHSAHSDILYLLDKQNAGAAFIITQISFSSTEILHFINMCRLNEITIPIIPGIFVPYSFKSLVMMSKCCSVQLEESLFAKYKALRDDDVAFRKYALSQAEQLIGDLFRESDEIIGVHFFSFNNFEMIREIIRRIKFELN